jgi:hypothetical protein
LRTRSDTEANVKSTTLAALSGLSIYRLLAAPH